MKKILVNISADKITVTVTYQTGLWSGLKVSMAYAVPVEKKQNILDIVIR